jgi:hypothetical protein
MGRLALMGLCLVSKYFGSFSQRYDPDLQEKAITPLHSHETKRVYSSGYAPAPSNGTGENARYSYCKSVFARREANQM